MVHSISKVVSTIVLILYILAIATLFPGSVDNLEQLIKVTIELREFVVVLSLLNLVMLIFVCLNVIKIANMKSEMNQNQNQEPQNG